MPGHVIIVSGHLIYGPYCVCGLIRKEGNEKKLDKLLEIMITLLCNIEGWSRDGLECACVFKVYVCV